MSGTATATTVLSSTIISDMAHNVASAAARRSTVGFMTRP
jgi:hypothetical protein